MQPRGACGEVTYALRRDSYEAILPSSRGISSMRGRRVRVSAERCADALVTLAMPVSPACCSSARLHLTPCS